MKHLLIILLLIVTNQLYAQLDPVYAQYLNNPLILNPAYAGSNNMFNANLQYRSQWTGLDANPTTINFNSHMAVFHNRVGLGLMVVEDRVGENKNTDINTIYSYRIQLKKSWLFFGLQTGFVRYKNNPTALLIRDPGDPSFNYFSEIRFNTGAGIMLKNDLYMLGVSVPRLRPVSVSTGAQTIQVAQQNYYIFGSYVFFLSEDIKFRPSFLVRGTQGLPFSVDLNTSLVYRETFAAGIFTRKFNTYGLQLNVLVEKLRVGYVFELPGSKSALNFTTHEFMIGISMSALTGHDKFPTLY